MTTPILETLVANANNGDQFARQQLFAVLYDELHRIARAQLRKKGGGLTISTTTLLHDAYLSLSARDGVSFPDKNRFLGYAASAMRGIIVDYARNRQALKRGGGFELTSMDSSIADNQVDDMEIRRVNDELQQLAVVDAPLAELVDLKYFCGLTFAEIAAHRGISERTVQRDWKKAKLYLFNALAAED